jgi:hypothetical protein
LSEAAKFLLNLHMLENACGILSQKPKARAAR